MMFVKVAVAEAVGVEVGIFGLYKYNTESPLKGAVNEVVAPPDTVPPSTVVPLPGLNHSTDKFPSVAEIFTDAAPPFGRYTRYSAPSATGFAKQ